MKTRALLFLFISAVLISCDPIQVLIIKTSPDKNESISIYTNDISDLRNKSNEKVVINVPYTDSILKHEKIFAYGIGGWSEYETNLLTENIDSIIINNDTGKITLKEQDSIKNYLLDRRSGWAESVLTIGAE